MPYFNILLFILKVNKKYIKLKECLMRIRLDFHSDDMAYNLIFKLFILSAKILV